MATDSELNVGGESDGKTAGNASWSTSGDTVPKAAYKKLQGDLQKAKEKVKEFEQKALSGMDVETQLQEERSQRAILERELSLERTKRTAPEELHGFIDTFAEKYGKVPDEEDLEFFTSKLPKKDDKPADKQTSTPTAGAKRESSGIRNSSARVPDNDADIDAQLKSVRLDDVPSFAGR